MARELKDIKLKEVSLVDKAANKKKFLFYKQEEKTKKLKKKINIVIDSDGTIGGTKIVLNKEKIKGLSSFSFSFWESEDATRPVSCSYSKVVETDDGFSRSESFFLSKGDSQMDPKVKEKLQEYFGEKTEEIDFDKATEKEVIVKALETVTEYQEDFPDDLKMAVGALAIQAGFCDNVVSKMLEKKDTENTEDKKNLEKAGAKFSKETLKKLADILTTLKSIIPELEESTKKSDNTDVEKMLEGLQKSIVDLEKKKDNTSKDELTKTIDELTKRLQKVEKNTGVKKGLTGQDIDEEEDEGTTEKKWPSFQKK